MREHPADLAALFRGLFRTGGINADHPARRSYHARLIAGIHFFSGNWYICRYGWLRAYPVNPLWSISVEEQFYITIPLVALYCRRRSLAAVCLCLIAVAYVAIALYAQHPRTGFSSQWTNSFVQFQFFSAGTLLSLALRGRLPQLHPLVRVGAAAAAIGCWLVAFLQFGVEADNRTQRPSRPSVSDAFARN
jgi:peptidoglycan/LPS O-acetylase OafA/YrhL